MLGELADGEDEDQVEQQLQRRNVSTQPVQLVTGHHGAPPTELLRFGIPVRSCNAIKRGISTIQENL